MIDQNIKQICRTIAQKYPTPFYLIDLDSVINVSNIFSSSWKKYFKNFSLAYSYKTNSLKIITQLLRKTGAAAEVVSGAELNWAIEDGFNPESIFFNGPVKRHQELEYALKIGVNIQIDSLDEFKSVVCICKNRCILPKIAIRLATDYKGLKLSRFGLTRDEYDLVSKEMRKLGSPLRGIHIHVGSNVNSSSKHIVALNEYLPIILDLFESGNNNNLWLDIGGGFPAKSLEKDITLISPEQFACEVADFLQQKNISPDKIKLIIEPGRSLVEDFGYLIAKVEVQKIREEGNLAVVDAGVHLVKSLSTWYHPVEFISESTDGITLYNVYGSNCFELDLFGKAIPGPNHLQCGDLVIVGEAGGYDISTASVWTTPGPAIYGILDKNKIVVVRNAQSWKDVRVFQDTLQNNVLF